MRYFLDLIPREGGKKWMIPLKRWHYAVSSIHPSIQRTTWRSFPNERPLDMTSQWLGWTCSKYPTLRLTLPTREQQNGQPELWCAASVCIWRTMERSLSTGSSSAAFSSFIARQQKKKCKAKNGYYWRFTSFNPNYSLFSARPTWRQGIRLVPFDCFVMKKQRCFFIIWSGIYQPGDTRHKFVRFAAVS